MTDTPGISKLSNCYFVQKSKRLLSFKIENAVLSEMFTIEEAATELPAVIDDINDQHETK